jgi:membrane dipeptidase
MSDLIPIFDGHNDVLLRLHRDGLEGAEQRFLEGEQRGHLDLPRAKAGGFAGGLFAFYVPSRSGLDFKALNGEGYAIPLPPGVNETDARTTVIEKASIILRVERTSGGAVAICRRTEEVRAAMARGALAVVMHLEGAEAIDPGLRTLDVLHAAGLRSLGPVWSRDNVFGGGVPMRFPSSPDIGPGLTDLGFELVRACNRLRILVDLSHLTDKGFWDVARTTDAPLVATHSNVHAISPSSRNLTDRQLDAIRESDGMVGVNFATSFLRPDGQMRADTDLDLVIRHVDALIERIGETRVGFGSDYDGAVVPNAIKSPANLQRLVAAMRARGYDEPLLRKLGHENWLRALERTIG